jgi:hypothetical protein
VNVVTVRHRIGLLELGLEALIERDTGDSLARQGAAHFHCWRAMRVGQYRVLQPELLQGPENVRPQLNASADLAKLGRLFEHAHRKAFARKRMRRGEAADAASHDQNRRLPIRLRHFFSAPMNRFSLAYI